MQLKLKLFILRHVAHKMLQHLVQIIDQKSIYTISEEKINHYNKILSDQLSEIKMEITGMEAMFGLRFNIPANAPLSPKTAILQLERDIKALKKDIHSIKNDLSVCQDIAMLKSYLKTYRIARSYDEDFWYPFT